MNVEENSRKEEHKPITIILKKRTYHTVVTACGVGVSEQCFIRMISCRTVCNSKSGMAGLISDDGTLEKDIIWFSLIRVLKGWIPGASVCGTCGLCVGYFKPAGCVLEPFRISSRFIPAIGFITPVSACGSA